jgi:hypothetical protein
MGFGSCDKASHNYVAMGTRLRCTKCGAVQIDLTAAAARSDDAVRMFRSRRPTLFSLITDEAGEEGVRGKGFGRPRHRRG